ncbi:unnamed protein product, partial [marine sediment metagenome]
HDLELSRSITSICFDPPFRVLIDVVVIDLDSS